MISKTKMAVYIAGPMRGYDNYNHAAFLAAEKRLKATGWVVVNPSGLDLDLALAFEDVDLAFVIRRDTLLVQECDAIYMLDGWEDSLGASAEWALAMWAAKEVMYATSSEVSDAIV